MLKVCDALAIMTGAIVRLAIPWKELTERYESLTVMESRDVKVVTQCSVRNSSAAFIHWSQP